MTVDKTGKWWKGTETVDLHDYLKTYAADGVGYPVGLVVDAKCACGADRFRLEGDQTEGCARRKCIVCGEEHFICDSTDYWQDAQPEEFACPECEGEAFEVAVGFSFRQDDEVRWITVGGRCRHCGVLGVYADWKIDYSPSRQLLTQA